MIQSITKIQTRVVYKNIRKVNLYWERGVLSSLIHQSFFRQLKTLPNQKSESNSKEFSIYLYAASTLYITNSYFYLYTYGKY